jgi:4-amino-4-deoxy-L-arabinose transferase-like glycosyltransferase
LAVLTAVLLVGAALRLVGLNNVTPPGLEHDEVAHWLINQDILAGNHAIYFTEAYGHEALYHYLQTAVGVLVGDHALGLRLPSAYLGILLIAVSYALGRRLFGWQVALLSAAFLAVLFWPVFYSRLALRAISLPVLSGLAALLWWLGWSAGFTSPAPTRTTGPRPPQSWLWFGLAGLAAGLSLHTYMAARAVPIFFVLFTGYLLLFHRATLRDRWQGVALFFVIMTAVALPLVVYLQTNPGAEFRIGEVDAPLRALLVGDVGPVLANSWRIALMFGVAGDPLWRQGIAGQPVFGPLMALLFYGGVGLAVWRWRDARYVFLLLWLGTAVVPSVVTIDAPSTIRIVNLLPILLLFPALVIHRGVELSTALDKLSTTRWITGGLVVITLMWGWALWRSVDGLWRVWPAEGEVAFVWQRGLTEAAAFLDADPTTGPVAVGGWTPATMDEPTMELSLRREDLSLRFFDPTQSLILPVAPPGSPARIVRPAILPLAPPLEALVAEWAVPVAGDFALYHPPDGATLSPSVPVDALFGDEVRLIGYDLLAPCVPEQTAACTLLAYWLVEAAPSGDRRFFLHALDSSGVLAAQDDKSGAPAAFWRPGDLIVQQLAVPPSVGGWRLGVYDPATEGRLTTATGADAVVLTP